MTNAYEHSARVAKAVLIADVLMAQGATPAQVDGLDELGRRCAERLAGTKVASETTWELVLQMVEARSQITARQLSETVTDPFAKFPGN